VEKFDFGPFNGESLRGSESCVVVEENRYNSMNIKLIYFWKKLEFALHICMLVILMGAFVALWRQMSGFPYDPVDGDPIQRNILLLGYLITIPTILFYTKNALRVVIRSPVPWLMTLWAALSILWSGSPDITFRRVIAILLTTLYSLVLYLRYPYKSFFRLLGIAFFIAILSSLLMVVVKPEWGIMSSVHEGAWQGVFVHKNSLGKVSVFAIWTFNALWSSNHNPQQRMFWASAFVLGVVTLIGSQSASALVIASATGLGVVLLRIRRPWRKAWPIFLLITLVIGTSIVLLVIQNSEVLLEALGRDISLTGRIPLWNVLTPMGLARPLGYGYGAFWLGWNGPSAEVWSTLNWYLPNAHNGFLELWLNLGWLGLGLGLILLGKIFLEYFGAALAGSEAAVFWILFGIIIVTYNLVETTFFSQNVIYWVLISYAYISTRSRKGWIVDSSKEK